ncbi:MAG: hypothetical protein ACTJGR_05325 [Pauljensenia sp.]
MSRWRTIPLLAAAVLASTLPACTTPSAPNPSNPLPITEGDSMSCEDGYRVSISGTAVFRPGTGAFPAYDVGGTRIEQGVMRAALSGVDTDGVGGFETTVLTIGESVTDPKAGTFTLLDVEPTSSALGDGSGGTATFCYEPAPDFEVNPELSSQQDG